MQIDHPVSTLDLQIDEMIASGESDTAESQPIERRLKPRLREPFPTRIWGVDSGDLPFNVDCTLDNISASGAYLRIERELKVGDEVRMIVHFLNGPTTGASATIQGRILRDDPQTNGLHGVAIAINRHRFL